MWKILLIMLLVISYHTFADAEFNTSRPPSQDQMLRNILKQCRIDANKLNYAQHIYLIRGSIGFASPSFQCQASIIEPMPGTELSAWRACYVVWEASNIEGGNIRCVEGLYIGSEMLHTQKIHKFYDKNKSIPEQK